MCISLYFINEFVYVVNLMQFFRLKVVFKMIYDFLGFKYLNIVNSCVFVGRKSWNKVDIVIFENCQWDSDDDMFSGQFFVMLVFQKNFFIRVGFVCVFSYLR